MERKCEYTGDFCVHMTANLLYTVWLVGTRKHGYQADVDNVSISQSSQGMSKSKARGKKGTSASYIAGERLTADMVWYSQGE